MGHAWELQLRAWDAEPGQARPPYDADGQARVRAWVPVPQVLEQEFQPPQEDQTVS